MKFILATIFIFFTNEIYAQTIYVYKDTKGVILLTDKERKDPSFTLVSVNDKPKPIETETRQIVKNEDGSYSYALGNSANTESGKDSRITDTDTDTDMYSSEELSKRKTLKSFRIKKRSVLLE